MRSVITAAAQDAVPDRWEVVTGDCIEVMRTLPDACADCVVTDPPYGLSAEPDIVEVLNRNRRRRGAPSPYRVKVAQAIAGLAVFS